MQCDKVRELLSPASDREVSPEERAQIEEHIATCHDCAFQSTIVVGLKRLMSSWEGVRAGERFHAVVLERIKETPSQQSAWPWKTIAGAGAAGLASIAVVVLLWSVYTAGKAERPPYPESVPGPADLPVKTAGYNGGAAIPGPAAGEGTAGASPAPLAAETPAKPVGQIDGVHSIVMLARQNAPEVIASASDLLMPGDALRVSTGGWAEAELAPLGLWLRLDGGAKYVFAPPGVDGELLAGEARLKPVAPNSARPAMIKCRTALVRAEAGSTIGLAAAADGGAQFVVADGSATVFLVREKHALSAGQALHVSADGTAAKPPAPAEPRELKHVREEWGRR